MSAATLRGRWRQAVEAVPDRPFLVWEGPDEATTTWTYAEFDAVVERVAARLAGIGVGPGAAVHLALANSPAFVAVWFAAGRLGAWIVPSDPMATTSELAQHLDRTKPVVGCCAVVRARAYRDAADGRPVAVVEVEEHDVALKVLTDGTDGTVPDVPDANVRAAVMFTSGTTSAPKGVEVTQANYAFAGDAMAAAAALTADDRCLVVLPMFHANAQYYSFAAAISVGASVALMPAFSASRFLAQAARHGATHASLFAAPIRMILAKQPAAEPALRLRHCWYAQNIAADQYEEIARLLGCRPRQLYGMTETMAAVLTSRPLTATFDAMGEPTLGCTVRLADLDTGAVIAEPDVVGEVQVHGRPGVELLAGYLDDPATTASSYSGDGWFRTGDRAWVDDRGWYHFAGRGADVLKVAGENVSTVEIEAVLSAHPDVLEAAVIGEPDDVRDEVPVAYVVKAPNIGVLDVAVLDAWCESKLSKVKRPRRIEVVDELPRTSVGKIRKFLLRQP